MWADRFVKLERNLVMKDKRIAYIVFYRIDLLLFLLLLVSTFIWHWGRGWESFLICGIGMLAGMTALVAAAVKETDARAVKWVPAWIALIVLPPLLCLVLSSVLF